MRCLPRVLGCLDEHPSPQCRGGHGDRLRLGVGVKSVSDGGELQAAQRQNQSTNGHVNLRFDPWRVLARRSLEKPLLSAWKKPDACVGICGPVRWLLAMARRQGIMFRERFFYDPSKSKS